MLGDKVKNVGLLMGVLLVLVMLNSVVSPVMANTGVNREMLPKRL